MMLDVRVNAEDNPLWYEAMNGQYSEDYWWDSEVELDTLERKIKARDIVDRHEDMNVLQSNW